MALGTAALGIATYLFVVDRICKDKRKTRRFKAVPQLAKSGGVFRFEARF
jgi:hypothetical protein